LRVFDRKKGLHLLLLLLRTAWLLSWGVSSSPLPSINIVYWHSYAPLPACLLEDAPLMRVQPFLRNRRVNVFGKQCLPPREFVDSYSTREEEFVCLQNTQACERRTVRRQLCILLVCGHLLVEGRTGRLGVNLMTNAVMLRINRSQRSINLNQLFSANQSFSASLSSVFERHSLVVD